MTMHFWVEKTPVTDHTRPADVPWERDPRGYYHRLLRLHPNEAGLTGVGGVYVMWHRGLHPKWLYAGATNDLGKAIGEARDRQMVLKVESFGSVYVTWAPIKPEFRDGVALYLRSKLDCEFDLIFETDHLDPDAEPVPVLAPQ